MGLAKGAKRGGAERQKGKTRGGKWKNPPGGILTTERRKGSKRHANLGGNRGDRGSPSENVRASKTDETLQGGEKKPSPAKGRCPKKRTGRATISIRPFREGTREEAKGLNPQSNSDRSNCMSGGHNGVARGGFLPWRWGGLRFRLFSTHPRRGSLKERGRLS